jgi:hypothetical protein
MSNRLGGVKAVYTMPTEVALLVRWKIQMEREYPVMLDASTETNCPAQTMLKPVMPERRCDDEGGMVMLSHYLIP